MHRLTEARTRLSKTVASLAQECAISRQTVYAIESGAFVPNALTAIRLARALDSTVEELFTPPAEKPPQRKLKATLLWGLETETDRPPLIRLARVGDRLLATPAEAQSAFLPEADATAAIGRGGNVFVSRADFEGSDCVLLAGCDPALSQLKSCVVQSRVQMVLCQSPSRRALDWLKSGSVHIAGCHVRGAGGEYNLPLLKRMFRPAEICVMTFAQWQQGLVVAKANPKHIRSVADLARRNVRLINRDTAAGSRQLLDRELRISGVETSRVRGYDTFATGHLQAAEAVYAGRADCCVATEAAAAFFGLGFVPISTERFDLVLRRQSLEHSGVKAVLDSLQSGRLRRRLQLLAGYDTAQTGTRVL